MLAGRGRGGGENAPCRKGEKDVEKSFLVTDRLPYVFLRASNAVFVKHIKNNTVFDCDAQEKGRVESEIASVILLCVNNWR